jgi:site-specific recombinase XerD
MTDTAREFKVAGSCSSRHHELSAEAQAAVAATLAAFAPNTQRAYRADFEDFTAYCAGRGACALPATPHLIADYLAARAEQTPRLKLATLARRLATVRSLHQAGGYVDEANPRLTRRVARGCLNPRAPTDSVRDVG